MSQSEQDTLVYMTIAALEEGPFHKSTHSVLFLSYKNVSYVPEVVHIPRYRSG